MEADDPEGEERDECAQAANTSLNERHQHSELCIVLEVVHQLEEGQGYQECAHEWHHEPEDVMEGLCVRQVHVTLRFQLIRNEALGWVHTAADRPEDEHKQNGNIDLVGGLRDVANEAIFILAKIHVLECKLLQLNNTHAKATDHSAKPVSDEENIAQQRNAVKRDVKDHEESVPFERILEREIDQVLDD